VSLLAGTRNWSKSDDSTVVKEQFIAACGVLATYARDGARVQRVTEETGRTLLDVGSRYFAALPIDSVADLVSSIEVLWRTPPHLYGRELDTFLQLIPHHNRTQEVISSFLEGTHTDALEHLLERVWKSPSALVGESGFQDDLAERVMNFCLPATEYEPPLRPEVIDVALKELSRDVENCKSDVKFAIEIARGQSEIGAAPPLSRSLEKDIRRAFRKRSWSPTLDRLYTYHCDGLNDRLSHLAKFVELFGWNSIQVPIFSATPGKRFH